MKKVVKTRAFKDRLKGHKDGVISLFSEGPTAEMLFSASKDGGIRGWHLKDRKISVKLFASRTNEITQDQENQISSFQNAQDDKINDDKDDFNKQNQKQKQKNADNFQNNVMDDKNMDDKEEVKQNQKDIEKKVNEDQFTAATFSWNSENGGHNQVFGAFEDGLIYSWDLDSGETSKIFEGHLDKITNLAILNNTYLVSTSLDTSIRIWDINKASSLFIYKLKGPVNQLKVQNSTIFAICNKNIFYEIDTQSHKILRCIKFANTAITSFILINNSLIFGTINNTIELYDLQEINDKQTANQQQQQQQQQREEEDEKEGQVVKLADIQPKCVVEGLNGWVLCMNFLENYLYTGGDDKKIKVWKIKDNQLLLVEELAGHEDGIISIDFAGSMLYSGSYDHSIRSWDLKEMHDRVRERSIMFMEDLWSKKYDAYYNKLYAKKKKKKAGKAKK